MPKDLVSSMEKEVHDSKLKTFVQTAENIDYQFVIASFFSLVFLGPLCCFLVLNIKLLQVFSAQKTCIIYVFNKFYHLYSTITEVAKVLVFLLVKSFEWNSDDICHLSGTTFGNSKGLK